MKFIPSIDDVLELRCLSTVLPVGVVSIIPTGGSWAPLPADPTLGPVNTITGQTATNPLPQFTPATPGECPE